MVFARSWIFFVVASSLSLTVTDAQQPPMPITVTLDSNKAYLDVNLYNYHNNTLLTVQTDNTYTLDLFVATDDAGLKQLEQYTLYNGSTTTNSLGKLSDLAQASAPHVPRLFTAVGNVVSLLTPPATLPTGAVLFFRIRDWTTSNCPNGRNVWQADAVSGRTSLTFVMPDIKPCIHTVLAYGHSENNLRIGDFAFSADANETSVIVAPGVQSSFKYFQFFSNPSSGPASSWNAVVLRGAVNSFALSHGLGQPANGTFTLSVENTLDASIPAVSAPARGVLYTNSFVGIYTGSVDEGKVNEIPLAANTSVTLTCTFFNLTTNGLVQLTDATGNNLRTVMYKDQKFKFSSSVTLNYKEGGPTEHGVVLEFETFKTPTDDKNGNSEGISAFGVPTATIALITLDCVRRILFT